MQLCRPTSDKTCYNSPSFCARCTCDKSGVFIWAKIRVARSLEWVAAVHGGKRPNAWATEAPVSECERPASLRVGACICLWERICVLAQVLGDAHTNAHAVKSSFIRFVHFACRRNGGGRISTHTRISVLMFCGWPFFAFAFADRRVHSTNVGCLVCARFVPSSLWDVNTHGQCGQCVHA